jgi:hypothetical protein
MEIIKDFDLPIVMTEFFSPVGKKEEITFPDFCSLFKSTECSKGIFFNTSKKSADTGIEDIQNETTNNFPIIVSRK